MRFITYMLFLANVYEIIFGFIKKEEYKYTNIRRTRKFVVSFLKKGSICRNFFFRENECNSSNGPYIYYKRRSKRQNVCTLWGEGDEKKEDIKKKKKDAEELKFYDFSLLYKNWKPEKKSCGPTVDEAKESVLFPKYKKNEYEAVGNKSVCEKRKEMSETPIDGWSEEEKVNKINSNDLHVEGDKNINSNSDLKSSSDSIDHIKTDVMVIDEPSRIERMRFENIYDYSDIFKEREKRVEVKSYVADIFQKFPKFKDNLKVIKDALLYLKFIEKGNLYLIKNVDRRTINSEPYDDLSKKQKNKGTKKNKIKLELSNIYNTINKEKHMKKRICKESCIKVDLYTKLLSRPLNNINNMHKNLKNFLHPFQYSLYVNTITNMYREGESSYSLKDVLYNIIEVRKLITLTGKTYAGQMKYLKTCRDIFAKLNEAIEDMNIILQSGRKWLDMYNSYVKRIRKIKYVDITKPAIVLLGCPNVGKSSILNSITNAKSPIADYSFTTKDFHLGHYSFTKENEIYTTQIMDLPGLLNRPEEKRNCMEELTLSSLKNLPSAVIYVFDPFKRKDHKHSSLKDQIDLRYYLRGLFPFRPWIDVITKYDLLEKIQDKDKIDIPNEIKENALFISTEIKDSLLHLKQKIHEVTYKLTDFLNDHTTTTTTTN